ncbi:MAG: T9SS type A sorting domain-containing protein [Saprospiraceae bacterium]
MKQILLLSFLFLINLNLSKAQDFDFTPNNQTLDTVVDMTGQWFEFEAGKIHSDIHNNTNTVSDLWWNIVQIDGPVEWKAQLCVNDESGSCFSWGVASNTDPSLPTIYPLIIPAGGESIFDIGVRPSGISGCGTYEVRITPMGDTTNVIATGIYNFRFNVDADCNSLVATENFDKSTAKIFPNPTSDYFTITDNPYVKSLEIFNIVGKQMSVASFQNGNTINVSNFPNGIYLVRMLDDDGDVLKTTRLIKR